VIDSSVPRGGSGQWAGVGGGSPSGYEPAWGRVGRPPKVRGGSTGLASGGSRAAGQDASASTAWAVAAASGKPPVLISPPTRRARLGVGSWTNSSSLTSLEFVDLRRRCVRRCNAERIIRHVAAARAVGQSACDCGPADRRRPGPLCSGGRLTQPVAPNTHLLRRRPACKRCACQAAAKGSAATRFAACT